MAENDIEDKKSEEKRVVYIGGEPFEIKNAGYINSYLAPPYPPYIPPTAPEFEQEQPRENEIRSSAEIDDYEIIERTKLQLLINGINKLSLQLEKHDTKMTREHQQMLQKLESENAYFRKQLAEINTPTKLQKSAFLFGIMSFISLGIGKLVGINLLHPIVAYFIFGISTVFYIMATMMRKQEKKQG